MGRLVAGLLGLIFLAGFASALGQAQQEQLFDPYKAEKNIEVGLFYLKKKNYDAAIERFKDAIRYKPNFARAHLLLGEAYEKKGDKQEAIAWYQKYLQILPSADDAEKTRKRIQKLTREIAEEAARRKRRSG
jgi:Tfp pilus assembly protein PilF